MSKKPKFTFKREPKETGLRSVGHPYQSVDIKLNKRIVGHISAPSWSTKDGAWGVGFMINGSLDNPNCKWHWKFLENRFAEEQEARDWVQEHAEEIIAWKLRFEEEDN